MTINEAKAAIEAILFATGDALSLDSIANGIGIDIQTTKKLLSELMSEKNIAASGIHILSFSDKYQMTTNPDFFPILKNTLLTMPKPKLTPTLLETLAIIAYKQPISKIEIEEIRGVDPNHAINRLIEFELVEEKGRKDQPGKPIIFGTTDIFLRHFGLSTMENLPKLDTFEPELLPNDTELLPIEKDNTLNEASEVSEE